MDVSGCVVTRKDELEDDCEDVGRQVDRVRYSKWLDWKDTVKTEQWKNKGNFMLNWHFFFLL